MLALGPVASGLLLPANITKLAVQIKLISQGSLISLVFANSISCIKRLSGLLKVLDIMPLTLHACMHQKQRLRNLEQFAHLEE